MEPKYQHTVNGQSVYEEDLNMLGEAGALADDRVFAELCRLLPFNAPTVAKGVMRYGTGGIPSDGGAPYPGQNIVWPSTGGVIVKPFRAFVGPRAAPTAGTEKTAWRDIRSAILIGSAGAFDQAVTFAATGAGVYRLDLLYAAVTPDANGSSTTRKVKDPTTGQITTASIVVSKNTTVTLGVVTGTPGSTTPPNPPSDAAGTYYIPIAIVFITQNFGPAVPILARYIWEIAEPVTLCESTGASVRRVASGNYNITGAVQTRTPWAFTLRKPAHMPPTMTGEETIDFAIDLCTAAPSGMSHNTGDIVDNSRDWTRRLWETQVCGLSGASSPFYPWEHSAVPPLVPAAGLTEGVSKLSTVGQSMYTDLTAFTKSAVCQLTHSNMSEIAPGATVDIYVDQSTGALHVQYSGAPNVKLHFRARASAQYANAG